MTRRSPTNELLCSICLQERNIDLSILAEKSPQNSFMSDPWRPVLRGEVEDDEPISNKEKVLPYYSTGFSLPQSTIFLFLIFQLVSARINLQVSKLQHS